MTHIMLDLETFGTKPGSVLRSIGAVAFDLDGKIAGEFYANIDQSSCEAAGLVCDPNTVKWWSQQSQEAQDSLLREPQPLAVVVDRFHTWYRDSGGSRVWAQGANFDPPLWEAAASAVKTRVPWKFYETRDTRTVYDIGALDTSTVQRAGTYHNALDDAKHQVRCVVLAIQKAKGGFS